MKYLRKLQGGIDVSMVRTQLETHPDLWNQFTLRTKLYQGPHNSVSDIWMRYRHWSEFDQQAADGVQRFVGEPHDSSWYPAAYVLTALKEIIFDLCRTYEVERLGGVLITRIPAGGQVAPHIDRGWHATYYEKLALQLQGNEDQAFCFEDGKFRCGAGTLYTFDNSKSHWVTNESPEDRITAIICVRRDPRLRSLVESE
jgi:Aspartyl/Asparaginyl beta-hydroxylase